MAFGKARVYGGGPAEAESPMPYKANEPHRHTIPKARYRVANWVAYGAYNGEPIYRTVAEQAPNAEVIIPPHVTAVMSDTAKTAPSQRDRHIQMIAERGRLGWQRAVHYGRRSLAEVAMLRYKVLIGRSLRARTLPTQKAEARVACAVINRMTGLGMPVSRKIA